jgi:hypothetical protein
VVWLYTAGAERVYARAGWHSVETVQRHGRQPVTLMRRDLTSRDPPNELGPEHPDGHSRRHPTDHGNPPRRPREPTADPTSVTAADCAAFIDRAKMWVWAEDDQIQGFSVGDPRDGSIWLCSPIPMLLPRLTSRRCCRADARRWACGTAMQVRVAGLLWVYSNGYFVSIEKSCVIY